MSEAPLAPPESRPDDDEDVAWALQTASTLWARGEAADAFVWLRRAADAATRAGQDYRASELGVHAAAMEEAMRDAVADPPTLDEVDVRMSAERMSADRMSLDRMSIEVEPDMLEEVTSDGPPIRIVPPPVPSGPPTRAPGGPPPPPSVDARPPVPPPVPTSKSVIAAPPASSATPTAIPPASSVAPPASRRDTHRPRTQAPAAPLDLDLGPDSLSPIEVRGAPSVAPLSTAPAVAPAPPRPAAPAPTEAPPSIGAAPAIPPPPSPSPPVVAPRPASTGVEAGGPSSSALRSAPASTRMPASEAPASASPLSTFRSFAGVPSIPTPVRAKRKPRAPIFDPWADEVPQDSVPTAGAGVEGQAWDDSAVFTSAGALDVLLRKRPPPPPPRRRTQTVDMSPSQRPALPSAAMGAYDAAGNPIEPTPTPPVSGANGVSVAPSASLPPAAPASAGAVVTPVSPPEEADTPPMPRAVEAPLVEAQASAPVAPPATVAHAPSDPPPAPQPPPIVGSGVEAPPAPEVPAPEVVTASPPAPPARLPSAPPRPASTPPRPASTPPRAPSIPPPPAAPADVSAASVSVAPPANVAPPRPSTPPRPTTPPRPAASTPPPPFEPPPPARVARFDAPDAEALEPPRSAAPPGAPPPGAAPAASPPPPATTTGSSPPSSVVLGGLSLDRAESLSDLPPKVQRAVIEAAKIVDLDSDEEVADFGVVLVLSGEIAVCAAVNDAPACRFATGSLAPSRGSFENGVTTRAVAFAGPARVAQWDLEVLREALQSCPWVLDELEERGDRVQARVGATLGPLGDLDDLTRSSTLDALTLRVFAPGEVVVEKGVPGTGIMVIGGGSVEVADDGARETLGCGDPLFASAALSGSPAPGAARAGAGGALLLVADRRGTQGLITSLPTLLELLASS